MKNIPFTKLFFACVSLTLILSSCNDVFRKSVSGEGEVVSDFRAVGPFTGIEVSSGIRVYISFGNQGDSLEVVTNENLQDVIETEVKGDILKIRTNQNIHNADKKDIFISLATLNRVDISSAANIIGGGLLQSDDLNINMSSAADLSLEVETEDLKVELSSSANAVLTGTCRQLDADVSSAADLDASGLITERCRLDVSSAGEIEVNVSDLMNGSASSAGKIIYQGNPKSIKINTSSAGKIVERNK